MRSSAACRRCESRWLSRRVREILFVAGEASGDTNAAGVVRELKEVAAPYELIGVGGDQMKAAGVHLIEHVRALAVMGFVGILTQLPKHWLLLNEIQDRLRSGRVALVVLVDYGGFNLHVAAAAKAAGVPVLYYITPQVWASRPGRIDDLAATVTKAAVIFRFEEELLRKHHIDATFVGHPILDRVADLPSRDDARRALNLRLDRRLLVLFPGSRSQEIDRHLGPFVETARRLQKDDPHLDVVVSGAPSVAIDATQCPYPVIRSSSWTLLRAADAAFCKSGTTTLEAAVAGCPFVIGYRAGTLDYAIAKQIITVSDIGMVNVVAGHRVVPEFVQDELEPSRIAPVLRDLLDSSSARRQEMIVALAEVRSRLGQPGASKRVAMLALEMVRAESPMPQATT
jgi:lipid-A-disaccharide synthase